MKTILERNKILLGEKSNIDAYHQELANFALSRKANLTTPRLMGDRLQYNYLYDMTATRAVKRAASGFHSNLTNPTTKWFGFTLEDQNRMTRSLEIWFDDVAGIMLQVLENTNLYNVLKEFYSQYLVFGTANILTMPHPRQRLTYQSIQLQGLCLEENDIGLITGVYRNFSLTAQQAWMRWGAKAGKSVIELYKDKPYEKIDFLHYVGPRDKHDPYKMDNLSMPYESLWINKKDEHLIEESGFMENPYHIARFWKEGSEVFGYSPTMDVLADIKLMNAMVKTWLRRAMKEADPPFSVPDKGYISPYNFNPSALNIRKQDVGKGEIEAIGVGAGNFSITEKLLDYIKRNIEEGLFNNVFQGFSDITKQMTVPEVQKRIQEGMIMLGPVVNQCQYEGLTPLIQRSFRILLEDGIFPEPPEEFFGNDFKPVYESPLARAARESKLQNIDNLLLRAGNMAAIIGPQVLDPIKSDKILQDTARILDVSPEYFLEDEEVNAIREQRNQIQQAQMAMEAAHKTAAIEETASKAR